MTSPNFMVIGLQIGKLRKGGGRNLSPLPAVLDSKKHGLFRLNCYKNAIPLLLCIGLTSTLLNMALNAYQRCYSTVIMLFTDLGFAQSGIYGREIPLLLCITLTLFLFKIVFNCYKSAIPPILCIVLSSVSLKMAFNGSQKCYSTVIMHCNDLDLLKVVSKALCRTISLLLCIVLTSLFLKMAINAYRKCYSTAIMHCTDLSFAQNGFYCQL